MNLSPQIEIQIIAVVVAVACALPGVFLVLRRMALMSDAISHAILLGIVLAFFVVEDLASPVPYYCSCDYRRDYSGTRGTLARHRSRA